MSYANVLKLTEREENYIVTNNVFLQSIKYLQALTLDCLLINVVHEHKKVIKK